MTTTTSRKQMHLGPGEVLSGFTRIKVDDLRLTTITTEAGGAIHHAYSLHGEELPPLVGEVNGRFVNQGGWTKIRRPTMSDETSPVTCPHCGHGIAYGCEYLGTYDGILVWECDQGHQWPRFPIGTRLGDLGLKAIKEEDTQ